MDNHCIYCNEFVLLMRRKLVHSCPECTKDSDGLIVFCELCQIENDTNDRIFMEKFGNNPRTIEPDDY